MRYINKEYGFTFRPPYLENFHKEEPKGPAVRGANYPSKYIIGAGLDYSAINGAMLIGKYGSLWGVKVTYFNGGKWMENQDFVAAHSKYSVYSNDGGYAHFTSGPLSVKWIRQGEQGLGIQITASRRLRVRVIFYPCFNWPGEISIEGSYVKGRSPYVAAIPGDVEIAQPYSVFRNRYQVILDDKPAREYFMAQSYNKPLDSANSAFNEVIMEFIINNYQPTVHLYCAVGDEKILAFDIPDLDKLDKLIETSGDLKYSVNKTHGSGVLGAPAESMFNASMWSRVYYPYILDTIAVSKRLSKNDHFDLNGVEENSSLLVSSWVYEDANFTNQLTYTIQDKILGPISAYQIFARQKDKTGFVKLFTKLSKIFEPDGALVLDETKDKDLVAHQWEDSPLKEQAQNKPMYSLDQSCLKLLTYDALERMAVKFAIPEAKAYGEAKLKLKQKINQKLYNEKKGLYLNRYTDDTWAETYGASSFYPLIAGAIETPEQLRAVVDNLTSKRQFWGEYIIPTLSKNNKEYGAALKTIAGKKPPYLDWRGAIAPYVNYLIYHGLIRYGLDEIASDFAYKCAKLWQKRVKFKFNIYSKYLPNGRVPKDIKYLSMEGNLLALIGMQSLIDVEYFRDDLKFAIRFGSFAKGAHAITNLKLLDRNYSIEIDNYTTAMLVDSKEVFKAEGGRCIVRQFVETKDDYSFLIIASTELKITLKPLNHIQLNKKAEYVFTVPPGKHKVKIADKVYKQAIS
ncbi:MAG TPA: hypothetical protein GX745_02335 [Clostridiales bacterium]|nr:hypothetical protein [Clostridiales bacterium]